MRPAAQSNRGFRMFAFDGLRGSKGGCNCSNRGYGAFGVAAERIGRLAVGSVLLLADRAMYVPVTGGESTTGDFSFRRRRTVQLVDPVDVVGIPEAVSFRQDVLVQLTDVDDLVPQGTQVVIPSGTFASVVLAAKGSTGVVAPAAGAVPTGQGGGELQPPPEGAWWTQGSQEEGTSWLKWGLVAVGVAAAGWAVWRMARRA